MQEKTTDFAPFGVRTQVKIRGFRYFGYSERGGYGYKRVRFGVSGVIRLVFVGTSEGVRFIGGKVRG